MFFFLKSQFMTLSQQTFLITYLVPSTVLCFGQANANTRDPTLDLLTG